MFELDEYYHTTCLNVQFTLMCWTGLAIFLWSVHPLPTRVSFRIRVASQSRKDDRDSCDTQGNASRGIVPPKKSGFGPFRVRVSRTVVGWDGRGFSGEYGGLACCSKLGKTMPGYGPLSVAFLSATAFGGHLPYSVGQTGLLVQYRKYISRNKESVVR